MTDVEGLSHGPEKHTEGVGDAEADKRTEEGSGDNQPRPRGIDLRLGIGWHGRVLCGKNNDKAPGVPRELERRAVYPLMTAQFDEYELPLRSGTTGARSGSMSVPALSPPGYAALTASSHSLNQVSKPRPVPSPTFLDVKKGSKIRASDIFQECRGHYRRFQRLRSGLHCRFAPVSYLCCPYGVDGVIDDVGPYLI